MNRVQNDLLPKSLEINGRWYEIRSDYRDIREIMIAMVDVDLSDNERAEVVLTIFYPGLEKMPPGDYQEAINKLLWFINCGTEEKKDSRKQPILVDWEKDFRYMVSPINKVVGTEIRALDYMHWWTFKAAWDEMDSECLYAQILRIRNKKAKNKPLDKREAVWYRENRDLVDIMPKYSESEKELFSLWGGSPAE